MKRSPSVQAAYDAFQRRIVREWGTMADYIRTIKFRKGATWSFEPNLFPYKGLGNRHWILWSIRPMGPRTIHMLLKGETPYRIQINNKSDQSIPEVWHAHIIFDA